jgi:hypothetical protein
MGNEYEISFGKQEEMKPLGRCRRKWKNIKTDIEGIGYVAVGSIYLSHERVKQASAKQ